MQFLDNIEDNSIVITSSFTKNRILQNIDERAVLKNIKFMTFHELKKGLFFDYTNEAIFHIMKHYKVNYNIAKMYLDNLYYISPNSLKNEKWEKLIEIKSYLNELNLLIYDSLFSNLLMSKSSLYVYGFDSLSKFELHILDLASQFIPIHIIDKFEENHNHEVYAFSSMEEEIEFVAEEIVKKIEEGIPLEKIFIANYSEDYEFTITRIFYDYHIPFYKRTKTTLFSTAIGQFFINNLSDSLDSLLYKIKKKFKVEENKTYELVFNALSSLVNRYYWADSILEIKDIIVEEMKQVNIKKPYLKQEIREVSFLNNNFDNEDYIFLIGFNLGKIPKLKRDEDYIHDSIKPSILETSNEYNIRIKNAYKQALKRCKNITITYKTKDAFTSYYPSFLIDEKTLITKKSQFTYSNYSDAINQLIFTEKLDKKIKYGEDDQTLPLFYKTYSIPYKEYSNQFTGIDIDLLQKNINDRIVFSYSNIVSYYECPFKFYIKNILKVDKYEKTIEQFIGSLFHYCLEKVLSNEFNIDDAYNDYIENHKQEITMTKKDLFFLDLLKKEIHFIIEVIQEQYQYSKHQTSWYEKKIEIDVLRKIKTKIKGFVDKILLFNNYAFIIDYKTSNKVLDKDLFTFGIGIQLPIYLYLLKQLDNNIEVAGLYLQHILNSDRSYDPKIPIQEKRKNNLKLEGITFNNIDALACFDSSYEKSDIIKSVSIDTKTNELKKRKHILLNEEKEDLIDLMETLILNCIDQVCEGDFKIHPILIDNKTNGCDFCNYKDICYKRYENYNYQKIEKKGCDEVE